MKNIEIKGARVHNLKNFDISIPKNKLIVATGVSGSGKSSLVFDIVFEEGRRQYLQSLGILSRIDDEDKFDSISGIGPTIAVQQNIVRQSNSRSTVGSRTNILSMLGLLYASEGQMTCYYCGAEVDKTLTCPNCGNVEERLQASYFSYNDPNGMCFKCSGRGSYFKIDIDKLVPNNNITLKQVFDKVGMTSGYSKLFTKKYKNYINTPFVQIPEDVKDEILYGHHVNSNFDKRSYCLARLLKRRYLKNDDTLNGIYTKHKCSECNGFRIGEEARRVFLNSKHIGDLAKMTITELHEFLETVLVSNDLSTFANNLIKTMLYKTSSLIKYRLGHLTLYREMPTLSGGEIQRLFLNSHIDSKMDSLIYILDEPTAGLHESEKTDLISSLKGLKDLGNTVIVVEHDKNVIEKAEHIIDIGPKAGTLGGQIIYQGDLKGLLTCNNSITGHYLLNDSKPLRKITNIAHNSAVIKINNAKTNNLKDISVSIPLGVLVGVAGVSGSGKSSLISNTLIPRLKGYFKDQGVIETSIEAERDKSESIMGKSIADKLEGTHHISGYAEVSQAPIGRNMKSNPATYIGIWDKIRKLFAKQPQAIHKKLSAGHFSFNSKGACSVCGGSGSETIWLGGNFNTDITCRECHGKRYNSEALSVKYKGKSIFDVLEMTVSEAVTFFSDNLGIVSKLKVMERIGMGYVKLGQPAPTLSGGEAQRIKLAKEIGKRRKDNILYVLDEPTTGLSLYDSTKLIELLDELVKKGNSVVVIEHDPLVLKSCDWIIELGPQGGKDGGNVIAEGSPQSLKGNEKSITGRYL